ncbi:acetyl/propionyl/methylcrotonyl-CoA carboxylase subunit alpha [Brackiella oedipodis]|uniref:acetyl/propionyl/methylcrotonyl-CoA carboxylase subunit alpha n=1 Tax=Brackiella oedipodis TaxID=124225 RepID=UPI00048C7DB3|nr:acetyl/propionyl/methylcrotonyl-CoA carboxylase subunit alpha [Brackiella oedipodis]
MFDKILIANRGEIACRVIRTAKRLGIRTVAVFSSIDSQAQHVLQADEAVCIGEAASSQSYLNADAIIEAALRAGAQAIHPGYGFLSENAEFAQACANHGLVFIGPSAEAIQAMGLKSTAKTLMAQAGVPLTPGYHGDNQDPDFLHQEADKIGYPLLIKASAGGGGKGMSLVTQSADFIQALAACKREAQSSFGNDTVLIERYVQNPRHVEVQIFADSFGNCVHLFERDCSVQRRHQKVLEEAPAPHISATKLEQMHQAAIDAALAVNYVGAGTIEFIVEQDGTAYFMEMNTRLQVEHPVTEMITGEDLVEWQLRVASGEALPKQQAQIQQHGHAIEARIYAEDAEHNFMPATGRIDYLHYPSTSAHVRIDSGIVEGDSISSYYDPMIAKLIVWGADRDNALKQLQQALNNFHLDGLSNNIQFLSRVATCPAFSQAQLDTGLIAKQEDFLFKTAPISSKIKLVAAFIALLLTQHEQQQHNPSLWLQAPHWRLNQAPTIKLELIADQEPFEVCFVQDKQAYEVHIDSEHQRIAGHLIDAHTAQIGLQQQLVKVHFSWRAGEYLRIFIGAEQYLFTFPTIQDSAAESDIDNALKAPMPGVITQVLVSKGQSVQKNDLLITMEAMKMEYSILAPADGVVEELFFGPNDQVQSGQELLSLNTEANHD